MTITTLHSWIHHDSDANKKSQTSTKSQVFRHVAAHRRLKRQERILKLRASALDVLKALEVHSKQLPSPEDHLQGSVDPFDTLPVPLTAEINDLLQFDRLYLSPALSFSKIHLHPTSVYLQDELAAHGYLACIAAIKSGCFPDPKVINITLKLKAEAMRNLRFRLPQISPTRLPRDVMALLYTETWCRNIEAAVVHVRLLEAMNKHYGLDIGDIVCVLHSEVQRAAMTLDNTMFTMEEKSWNILEAECTPSLSPEDGANKDFQSPVRHLLAKMREALRALDILYSSYVSKAVRQAVAIKCLHVMSLFLSHYNASSDVVEKYAALAALYRIRQEANMEQIPLCGIKLFDAGKVLIPRLRELLVATFDDPPSLRLWALSVGTMSNDAWFKQEFKKQVHVMSLGNPNDIGSVLDDFEHRDVLTARIGLLLNGFSDNDRIAEQ